MNQKMNIKLELPIGFLEEEERCGYVISKEMKKIWAVELDLFAEFDRVCRKYDIKYCACGGTMLGAVRHKGFIPWDDDMDVMMPRTEYNKLCAVAEKEFKYPYFFQTEYTDRGSFRRHAQLRNSTTTGIRKVEYERKYKFNQGIFFDIFPLDNVIENPFLYRLQRLIAHFYLNIAKRTTYWSSRYCDSRNQVKSFLKSLIFRKMLRNVIPNVAQYSYRKYEETLALYNNREVKAFSQLIWDFDKKYHRIKDDFRPLVEMDFEFLKIPVASNYDHALTLIFGEWHKLIKCETEHGGLIFDTEKPYTDYLKEEF